MMRNLLRTVCGVGVLALLLPPGNPLSSAQVRAASATSNGGAVVAGQQQSGAADDSQVGPGLQALFSQYCVSCHSDRLKTAGLSLAHIDGSDLGAQAEVLEKVVRKLRAHAMPPKDRPQPDEASLEALLTSLETTLDRAAATAPNPGRVASRRLNRTEYVNAVYDLLGLEVNGADLLPSDMAGFGFDNNADVLAMTPSLISRYVAAATKVSRLAMASPDNRPTMQVYPVGFETRFGRRDEDMPFATYGGLAVSHTFPLDGEYVFQIRLKRFLVIETIEGIDHDKYEIEVRVDHRLLKRFVIGGVDGVEREQREEYQMRADNALEVRVPIKAGTRLVSVGFTDSSPSPMQGFGRQSEGLAGLGSSSQAGIDKLSISGPFNSTVPEDTPTLRRIFSCSIPQDGRDELPCIRRSLTSLARRAYRRPVTDADVEPLMELYKEGRRERDIEAGMERALEALLSSPMFLFRVESEPARVTHGSAYRVSGLELASRLSFFLWRSLPDDELIDLGARGELSDPAVLAQQVRRMLSDERASRFMKDFSEQWLEVRNIYGVNPDEQRFRTFDDSLRKAMARETDLFFESQVREDRPIQELLLANYTYLNDQLAAHYGIEGIYGGHFRRVTLPDGQRQGLLGHGSILTVTSYANRTSVVLRGKWILENVLGTPPPPPPANVPALKENYGSAKPASLRERMEQHRKNPVCAACHTRMDPLGFALEHFDGIGRWRETDGAAEINAAIEWDGVSIESPQDFREALASDRFVHTVIEKLLTFALGRGLEYYDAPTVRQLANAVASEGYRWSSLIEGIVTSVPFQMRTASDRIESAN